MLRLHSSGERNHQITIQRLTESTGPSHEPVETWTTLATVQASRVPMGGRERYLADQVSAPFDAQWQISYRPDMDPHLLNVPKVRRLVYRGRVHDIVAADALDEKRGIELTTQSGGLLT